MALIPLPRRTSQWLFTGRSPTATPSGACDLLAPDTADELAKSSGEECVSAVVDDGLPEASGVRASQAYGRAAQVVMDDDVVFLAIVGVDRRITAAGCTSRGDRPYDCTVKGS